MKAKKVRNESDNIPDSISRDGPDCPYIYYITKSKISHLCTDSRPIVTYV